MTSKPLEGPRQVMEKGVMIQYPKLAKAVHFRGSDQYELSMITEDADVAAGWVEKRFPKVKPNSATKPTAWTCSLNRKVLNKDGSVKDLMRIVDENKQPLTPEQIRKIGNGSTANVIVFQGPYDNEFGSGNTNSLTAIQFTHIEEYNGSMDDVDFDIEGDGAVVEGVDADEVF
jgi:hypothetical protein